MSGDIPAGDSSKIAAMQDISRDGSRYLRSVVTAFVLPALLCSAMLLWVGCGSLEPEIPRQPQLTIFAAASLQDVAVDLAEAWVRRHPADVTFSFAGSNTLAQQIMASPKADVFISADDRWMDEVEAKGALIAGSRRHVLRNRLVLITRTDSELEINGPADLATSAMRHLTIGDPDAVPAGRYAKAALEQAGEWHNVQGRIVPSANVRSALALVESDPDIVGVVYETDAATSTTVKVRHTFEPSPELDIVYSAAVVDGDSVDLARSFLDFLAGPEAAAVIESHGFQTVD